MLKLNKNLMSGNMTSDPVLNHTASGLPVANFRLANNSMAGDKEKTCFIDCAVFGKRAEATMQFCRKGSPVVVEGRLDEDQWTDDKGQKRFKHYITVSEIHFLRMDNSTQEPAPDDVDI